MITCSGNLVQELFQERRSKYLVRLSACYFAKYCTIETLILSNAIYKHLYNGDQRFSIFSQMRPKLK